LSEQTEKEKVAQILRTLERQIGGELFLRNTDRRIGRIKVIRKGFGTERGRPDVIAWIELDLHVLGVRTSLRVPILVEAEEAGMTAAKEDYEEFFKEEKLDIPMLVVSRAGATRAKRKERATAIVQVTMQQVGFERVEQV
jgi:hypothetical protein